MIGAIAGDVIGSVHEGAPPLPMTFPLFQPGSRFTDDSVLTVAVAQAIREALAFSDAHRHWGRRYPASPAERFGVLALCLLCSFSLAGLRRRRLRAPARNAA
jgi:ADP-ribosylglycohydrolase